MFEYLENPLCPVASLEKCDLTRGELINETIVEDLVSKQKSKVHIWQYFGFIPNAKREPDNINESIYKLCQMKVAASASNSSNWILRQHMSILIMSGVIGNTSVKFEIYLHTEYCQNYGFYSSVIYQSK